MPNENVNTANVFSSAQNSASNNTNNNNNNNNNKLINNHAKVPEVTVKKPQTVSLLQVNYLCTNPPIGKFLTRHSLQSYKQSWKPANNHFQRYSDVRPRDDRRPNVMDLANQPYATAKVNGWKIYHLSSQIEELVSSVYIYNFNGKINCPFVF